MRIAIIDLGTNSVRFDIHELAKGKRIRQLHREKLMVRLGQGVFIDGKLNQNAVNRTLQAFESFKKTATDLGANKILAFATSALRDSQDRDQFVELIKKKVDIEIHVISGQEEAQLIALGILSNEIDLPKGNFSLIDIGGGSTEINICKGDKSILRESFQLGTARLQQVFLKTSPPESESISQLRRHIKSIVLPRIIADEWPNTQVVLGSSGTIRAISRLIKKKDGTKSFTKSELKKLIDKMSKLNTSELMDLPEMEVRRVDMILGGAILAHECMCLLGAKKMKVTGFSLRDGILKREMDLYQENLKSHAPYHLSDLISKAVLFGGDEARARKSIELAEKIFDMTKSLHRLHQSWRPLLTAAMGLRNIGISVSPTNYGAHSAYMVKNLDIFTAEPWETDLVSELCRHHADIKAEFNGHAPFKNDKQLRNIFMRLLSLLRIADALDSESSTDLKIRKIRILKHKVEFHIKTNVLGELKSLRVEQKQPLFVKTFKRQPILITKR